MNILPYELNWNSYNLTWVKQSIFCLLLCAYILLSGCQSVEEEMPFQPPTPSPESTKVTISPQVTRPTTIPTLTSTPKAVTATPIVLLLPPTPTEILPTQTATPSFRFTGQDVLMYTELIRGRGQIYALEPGGVSHFITSGSFFYNQSLSPDQTKVIVDTNNQALSLADSSAEKVITFNLQSQEILPLNLLSYPLNMFWSRDGTSLVYITNTMYKTDRLEDAANQLVLYDVVSGENQVLVEAEAILFTDGGWAIDNRHIAYVAKVNGQYDLFTINSETLEVQQLSNTPDIETMILWSPTTLELLVGTALDEIYAFESWPWGIEGLYLVDVANNEWQFLTDKIHVSLDLSWSPDGQQIVFVDNLTLCIKNLETGDESCPLPEPYRGYIIDWYIRPVWSPDMKWIAFSAYNGTCNMLYFWELETNEVISADFECDISSDFPFFSMVWSTADFSADQ